MLYSEHLWDKLDTVMEHWDKEKEAANDVINFYLRIRKLSLVYAEGLEKQLGQMASTKHLINPESPIAALKDYAEAIAKVQRSFAESLLSDIASPLQGTLTLQAVGMKDIMLQAKKHSKKLLSHRKKHAKAEQRVKSFNEVSFHKSSSSERVAKERQKTYNDTVGEIHKFFEVHTHEIKDILDSIQKYEAERLRVIQRTLVAFADFTSDQGRSLSEIGEMLREVRHKQRVRGFDIAKSLHDFVIQNIDETGPRTKPIPLKGQFFEMTDSPFDAISSIMRQTWEGQLMTPTERNEIRAALTTAEGRSSCLNWLNRFRASGAYEFRGLEATGEVLNILLDEAHSGADIANSCLCIVLSQTFFDNSHAFLQSKIIKHQLWQDSSFWDSAFAFKVQNDMDQFNKLCPDNISELQDKLRSVLFAQFSTFMIIMKSFDIEASVISEFVQRQSKKYHMTSIEQEALLSAFSTAELT